MNGPDVVILSLVVCNRCDKAVDMNKEFHALNSGQSFVCSCGNDEFSWRGRDEDTGEMVDSAEANLTRGRFYEG